jgi:predicted component of viral defense system (DUF524 family)
MKIIGFGFNKIESEKKEFLKDNLEINTNTQIKEVSEEKIEMIKDYSTLRFDFEFNISYNPNFASIKIKGYLFSSVEKKEGKEIMKEWKEGKLNDNLKTEILNFIILKVSLKALQIEEDLGLPYHIPFPRISIKKEE